MNARRVLALVLLPILAGAGAFAWYGLRSGMYLHLSHQGLPFSMIGGVSAGLIGARAAALLFGGLAAALVGPHVAIAFGLAMCSLGILMFAFAPPVGTVTLPLLALWLGAVGSGFATSGTWAAAAAAFARPRQGVRDALFFAIYGVVQIGAFLGSLGGSSAMASDLGAVPLFVAAAAVALLGAVVAAGLATSHLALPPVDPDDPTERADGRPLLLAIGLVVLVIGPWGGLMATMDEVHAAAFTSNAAVPRWIWYALNPAVVLMACVVGAVGAVGIAAARLDPPVLIVVGAGLLVCAVGGAIAALALHAEPSLLIVALLVVSGAEGLILPLLLSRLAGDMHWRAAALMVGGWLALSSLVAAVAPTVAGIAEALASHAASPLPIGLLAAVSVCVVGGLVVMAIAIPHHRLLRGILEVPRGSEETDRLDAISRG